MNDGVVPVQESSGVAALDLAEFLPDLQLIDDDPALVAPAELQEAPDVDLDGVGPATDVIRLYLRQIGKVPLLTAEQEVDIARRYEAGVQAALELAEMPTVSPAKRRQLEANVRAGRDAKDRLIEANLRLVVSIAKRYVGRGMPLLDLVQEGNLGLIRAVEKFDYTKGYKFSTYASWWIRQAVSRGVADQGRTIRVPVHMVEEINRVLRTHRTLVQELGREPSDQFVADRLDMSVERLGEIRRVAREPVSINTPVGADDGSELGDLLEDADSISPVESAAVQMLHAQIESVLGKLGERERQVVRLRYGLTDGEPHTLEEVGAAFGVTRERVRQIEAKTLAKLRHPQFAEQLRDYLA